MRPALVPFHRPRGRSPGGWSAPYGRRAPGNFSAGSSYGLRGGIAEAIRYKSMAVTDRAMLSRGVSVIRKKTLIVNLPGSPKAVKESLGFILDSLDHGLKILRGSASECARRD